MPHGGPYTIKLVATGGGATASAQQSFQVDNTPRVAVTAPVGLVRGPFDVAGTATFTPTLSAIKGSINAYLNGQYLAGRLCPTTSCPFSYQEVTGRLLTLPSGGPYTVRLVAAGGGATASAQQTFSVAACQDADHDALGRLLSKTFPDHTTASFTYDASGNLLTATNPHMAYTFTYDLTNRLTAVTDSRGLTLSFQYDALGRRTQMTYPDGSVVAYTYDAASRLAALTHDGQTFTYQYDRAGRRTSITTPNGVATTYAYAADRLAQLTTTDATGAVLQHTAYTHDAVGNRITKLDDQGRAACTDDAMESYTPAVA